MLGTSPIVYIFLYVRDLAASRAFFERRLGLEPVESDDGAAKYEAGRVLLGLNRAADFGIELPEHLDETVQIVFHVDDLDAARAGLEARGVRVGPPLRYEIGGTCDLHDLDGHLLLLYEPSAEALEWPSGEKYRALARSQAPHADAGARGLAGRPVTYVFLFVRDVAASRAFYAGSLGLDVLEEDDGSGVVKYDAGGVILATHLVAGDAHSRADAHRGPAGAMSLVFAVPDIDAAAAALAARGVDVPGGVRRGDIGAIAQFADPDGHRSYLYEPSAAALAWPSGAVLRGLLSTTA